MGVPSGGGGGLGNAQGRVTIDISALQAAQVAVQNAARQINEAMNQINPGAKRAQNSVNQLAQGLQQLGGAFGLAFGAAGVAQVVRFGASIDEIATAFRRQSVAARELAGSQAELNQLLEIYDRATGGVIGRAQALSDVTRLLAVGFADSAEELDTFVRAVRGISLATGRPQEFVVTQLQLELLNQTGFRLDQIGLGMEEVRRKADELRAANSSLTQQQAYQQAVLETANQKFGALTRSAEAQATGLEKLRKAWADFTLETGQNARPGINAFAEGATRELEGLSEIINGLIRDITNLREAMDELERRNRQRNREAGIGAEDEFRESVFRANPIGEFADRADRAISDWLARLAGQMTEFEQEFVRSSVGRDVGRHRARRAAAVVDEGFTEEQTAAIVEWADAVQEIERQAARDRTEATRQYEQQRTSIIRDFEQTIAREAQDFALQRQRAEEDYAISLQRIHRDIARREVKQAEDLERTIADARADASERAADRLSDLEERITDARADSRERIAELEEDFNRRRERAQRDHNERLRDAAAALDAVRVRELQRDFRNSRRDAQEDFDERVQDERESEAKRIDELKKAHEKQTRDEQEALEERIQQAQDAHQRQLDDAREADAQRIEDMAADFELRREREDEDRAIRLERLRVDHENQLAELANQHENRLIQIAEQAQEERTLLDEEFGKSLEALGIRVDKFIDEAERTTDAAIEQFRRWLTVINNAALVQPAPGTSPGMSPISGPFPGVPTSVAPSTINNRTQSAVIAPSIQIFPAATQSPRDIANEVREAVADLLEDLF